MKSQDGFHLDLQSLTPYSFVSIKTLEHSAGFGFEVLCAFVWTSEAAFLPCNSQYHIPKGDLQNIRWQLTIYFSWHCLEDALLVIYSSKMLYEKIWKLVMSFCADPEKEGVCCPVQGTELLCPAWCSRAI